MLSMMGDDGARTDTVLVRGRMFTIRHFVDDRLGLHMYGCGILPLRISRDVLIQDIDRAQGPEWRKRS